MEFELEKLLHKSKTALLRWAGQKPRGGSCRAGYVCHDHLGREYASKKKRADAYGLNHTTVDFRLKTGWTRRRH